MSNKESVSKTIIVALLLCLVCSLLLASSVILLKPVQQVNKALNLKENILLAAGLLPPGASKDDVERMFSSISSRIVDLETGEYVEPSAVGKAQVLDYDQRKAAKDPKLSDPIDPALDIAGIKRRVKYAKVYLVEKDGQTDTIILPVSGYGLWSTLHGFLALKNDANTVVGLGFYEHAETPGLGGEVDNPRWKAFWPGKKVYDLNASEEPLLKLVKGAVDNARPDAAYSVDGLSGATLTSRGVTNLIHYWMGAEGFQKYLKRLRSEA